jgi:hypothetical protein
MLASPPQPADSHPAPGLCAELCTFAEAAGLFVPTSIANCN